MVRNDEILGKCLFQYLCEMPDLLPCVTRPSWCAIACIKAEVVGPDFIIPLKISNMNIFDYRIYRWIYVRVYIGGYMSGYI